MEILLSFIAGLVVAAVVSVIVVRKVMLSRADQAVQTVKVQLEYAQERIQDLKKRYEDDLA